MKTETELEIGNKLDLVRDELRDERKDFINFLTHIQAYPVRLTPGLRAEINNYIDKLLKK